MPDAPQTTTYCPEDGQPCDGLCGVVETGHCDREVGASKSAPKAWADEFAPRDDLPAAATSPKLDRPVQQSTIPANPIQVWAFDEAPQHLRALSQNGGDEDWIALLPSGWEPTRWLPWAEPGTAFGRCCVDEYKWHGMRVLIGSHA